MPDSTCVKLQLITQLLRKFVKSRWDVRLNPFSFADCHILVLAPPVMLVRPQDQRFRDPGVTVVFTVNIIGEPRPVITWYHENHTVIFNDTRFENR